MTTDRVESRPVGSSYIVRAAWRRKWIVAGTTVLLLAVALGYSLTRTPLYRASATLVYQNQIDIADPLSTGGYVDPTIRESELANVANIIATPEIEATVREEVGQSIADSGYSVSAAPETIDGQSIASTVVISAVSASGATAARMANAYATAFVQFRKEQAQAQIQQAERVVQSKLDAFQSESSRQSAEYLILVQRLQDLQILEATTTGSFRILLPATPPDEPFSPQPLRNAVMGLIAGLVLGVLLALLIEQFDTRLRSAEEAATIFGLPVVGRLFKISAKSINGQPLVVLNDSRGPAAEAIRKLRSNLEFANVDGDLKSLFITSSLQHEGKSLAVCNLALSLAATGTSVLLVDGDLRRPQINRYLNLPNSAGLSTLLTGRSDLSHTIRHVPAGPSPTAVFTSNGVNRSPNGGERLHVITSGPVPPNPAEMIASKSFSTLMNQLRPEYDMVIVDAPSILAVGDAAAMAKSIDGMLFLIDFAQARRPVLQEAAVQVGQLPCRKLGLVLVGQFRGEGRRYHYYTSEEHTGPWLEGAASPGRKGVRV